MKTQESVLKQCVSLMIFPGLFLFSSGQALAYSSEAPWVNQIGPERGLTAGPNVGLDSSENESTDVRMSLSAALGDETSGFGRYSLQFDDRVGANRIFKLSRENTFFVQPEATFAKDELFGFTWGAFDQAAFRVAGLPTLAFEAGIGAHYTVDAQSTSYPFSFGLFHASAERGFGYGVYVRGEKSFAEDSLSAAGQLELSYTTLGKTRFEAMISNPVTEETPKNNLSLRIGFTFAFAQANTSLANEPRHFAYPNSVENLHYNLNAEVTSLNDALFLLKINRGSSDSVVKGQTFDIYSGEIFMARAQVVSVKMDEAALTVVEYKQEQWIELGFSARRLQLGE